MDDPGAPLIVTLKLDDRSFRFFDEFRQRHFPPERNFIPAHLTLFHHLPGTDLTAIAADLDTVTRHQPPVHLTVSGLRFLGRGVAFNLISTELEALRGQLARTWDFRLQAQDRQRFRPHVTIQNKVLPDEARSLFQHLSENFVPFTVEGKGILLWNYLGGPWEAVGDFPFQTRPTESDAPRSPPLPASNRHHQL
jgi:2'-5' RNA ligase